jgi:uncharacterized protein GlcG (DUF336 family)
MGSAKRGSTMIGEYGWRQRRSLSSEGSRALIDAAIGEAATMSVAVTVVVVDESGVLK